jgi:chromosomal replication initiator protein
MAKHSELLELTAEFIAKAYDLDCKMMFSKTRKKKYVEARQIFHYFAFKHLGFTLSLIGEFSKKMGRPEPHYHATVLHGYRTINDRKSVDRKFNVYMTTFEDELLESIMINKQALDKRYAEINQITKKAILTHNELIFEKVQELIGHIIKGDSEKDLDELIDIQVNKNHGRLYKASQGDNVLGKVSGHQYKSSVHTPSS